MIDKDEFFKNFGKPDYEEKDAFSQFEEMKKQAEEQAKAAAEAEAAAQAEIEAKVKAAEEEALRQQKLIEEAEAEARRMQEEAERIAREAEEAAKAQEEAAARARAEEEARIQAEAEEAARLAEELRAKKEAEEKAKAEEEARVRAEEEARIKAEMEAAAKAKKDAEEKAKAEAQAAEKAKREAEEAAREEARRIKEEKKRSGAINPPAVIAAIIIGVLLIVGSYIGSGLLFVDGFMGKGGAGSVSDVASTISSSLKNASQGISFNVAESKLCLANDSDYVVYFQTSDYKLYSIKGSYTNAGGTFTQKLNEAQSVKTDTSSATLVSENVTSFFVNTSSIADKSVTLSVRVGSGDIKTETVAVNVAGYN